MQRSAIVYLLVLLCVVAGCGGETTITASPTRVPTVTAAPALPKVKVLADVGLRAGPGADSDETSRVEKAAELFLVGHARGYDCLEWALVRTPNGEEGWVRPLMVNVDISKSTVRQVPLPAPVNMPTPSAACTEELALVLINNNYAKDLEVFMAGAEPPFILELRDNSAMTVCLAPGEYCYDITDGEKHETGGLFFPGGECTCWHWGGPPPTTGSCTCEDDPSQYQRP